MFNILERLRDYSMKRERADLLIRAWKSENKSVYTDFLKRIDAVTDGDLTILEEIIRTAKECCPTEILLLYSWLAELVRGKVNAANIATDIQQWAGRYTPAISECLVNSKRWLNINLRSRELTVSSRRNKGCIAVCSETPMEVWQRLPQEWRAYLISQTDTLIRNCGERCLFTKFEREKLCQALAYFSKLIFLAHTAYAGEFLANLYDKVIGQKEDLAYCIYYFVVFDHGLTKMAKVLDNYTSREDIDQDGMLLIKTCIGTLVRSSIEMGTETKSSWEGAIDTCSPEVWKEVTYLLHRMKGKQGNRKSVMSIDELIVGNKAKTKKGIQDFLNGNTNDICLAYLLKALVDAQRIKPATKYMTFHRAIEEFSKHRYGHDVPQKRYGEIKELDMTVRQRGASYIKAKLIIDEWTSYFKDCE